MQCKTKVIHKYIEKLVIIDIATNHDFIRRIKKVIESTLVKADFFGKTVKTGKYEIKCKRGKYKLKTQHT